jgi:hypothetical protein
VKGHHVWLKTLNLALMGGTPQHILLFLCVFIFIFIFDFSFVTFSVLFFRNKCACVQVWGECFESDLLKTMSSISRVRSFHFIHTLGTMCNSSLGVWETHLHTLGPRFCFRKKK